jgi:aspartate/glutamate racemase/ribosomal protein S18 acetylase RimI-like enzyme
VGIEDVVVGCYFTLYRKQNFIESDIIMDNNGTILPKEVKNNINFLKSKNVWYILSENTKVISCKDAAANRNRLGHKGIPIFDELKSELGFFINKENKEEKVLIHCRGNQKLDRLKISEILNSEYQRINNIKTIKGLINPFGKQFRNLRQIFDISTTKDFHPPYSMMTNAGDYRYALEFEVNSLIGSLKNASINDVIRIDNYKSYIRHKVGILTGNGPNSGVLLWGKINESVKKELYDRLQYSFMGDLSYPEIIIASVPDMGISMELDKRLDSTENVIVKSTIDLCQNGITIMCIACNTTQYYKKQIENICNLYNVNFVSIPDVINGYLEKNNLKEFDFFGISHVVDFKRLSAFKELNDRYTIPVLSSEAITEINKLAYIVKESNSKTIPMQAINLLKNIIRQETEYDTVVVALTEISTILSEHRKQFSNKTIVDSLQLLADCIAKKYVDGIFDTLYVDKDKDLLIFESLYGNTDKTNIEQELRNILYEIDYEFIPPLSYRDSTTFSFGANTTNHSKPEDYLKNVLNQAIILSKKKSDHQIVGFMSYIPDHSVEIKNKENIICYYISTIGVTKGWRGHGITNQFYKMIEEIVKKQTISNFVATRTWSTNRTHIKILTDLGYKKVLTIENDRGNGIHTVYFAKEIIRDENIEYTSVKKNEIIDTKTGL